MIQGQQTITPRVTEVAWNSRFNSCRASSTHPGCSLRPRLIIYLHTNSQARELRAFACYLVCNNYSLKHVVDAAFWRDDNTFVSLYLRHLSQMGRWPWKRWYEASMWCPICLQQLFYVLHGHESFRQQIKPMTTGLIEHTVSVYPTCLIPSTIDRSDHGHISASYGSTWFPCWFDQSFQTRRHKQEWSRSSPSGFTHMWRNEKMKTSL